MTDLHISAATLEKFTAEIFTAAGMPSQDAELEAEVLVWANAHGVDSHGVTRVRSYCERIDAGLMNPRPDVQILKETPATIFIEADRAFGPIVTRPAMEKCIAKAREVGVAWGLIRNCTHQGAMAYYSQMAARQGMAGMISVSNPPNMAPPGARVAGVHNSPIAIAVPGKDRPPISLDMATSIAAGGKLDVARDAGVPIPDDWALDKEGRPTTDPHKALILQPAGGYKGSGLALMFECLSSIMSGNPLLAPVLLETGTVYFGQQNSWMCVVDIGNFTDLETYKANVDELADTMNGLPTVDGADPIMVPGEKELKVFDERAKNGIPLAPGAVDKLQWAAERHDLSLPPELA